MSKSNIKNENKKHIKTGTPYPYETKKGRCESIVQYCEKEPGKRNDSVQDLVGYVVLKSSGEKAEMCEKCYQGAKKVQWEINKEKGWIHVEWFYFYDEERQKLEDKAQLTDYYSREDKFKSSKLLDISKF